MDESGFERIDSSRSFVVLWTTFVPQIVQIIYNQIVIFPAPGNNRRISLYINYLRSYASAVFSVIFNQNTQSFSDKNIAFNNRFLTFQLNRYNYD